MHKHPNPESLALQSPAQAPKAKLADLTWCILSKEVDEPLASSGMEGAKKSVDPKTDEQSASEEKTQPDLFEENFDELKKWVNVKSSKYGILLVTRERRRRRLGTALKVTFVTKLELIHQFSCILHKFRCG